MQARTMFGKLFGRSRKTEVSVLDSGLPSVSVTTSTNTAPLGADGTMDLSSLLSTVKEARDHAGGDPMKLVEELQQKFGVDGAVNGNVFTMTSGGMMPFGQPDVIGQLERLAKLHADGALTEAEFTAEKAKLIGPPTQPPQPPAA